jgi:hypothetical protein
MRVTTGLSFLMYDEQNSAFEQHKNVPLDVNNVKKLTIGACVETIARCPDTHGGTAVRQANFPGETETTSPCMLYISHAR